MKTFASFVIFFVVVLLSVNEHAWAMGKKTRSSTTRSDLWSSLNSQASLDGEPGFSQAESLNFDNGVGFDKELASLGSDLPEAPQAVKQYVNQSGNVVVSTLENVEKISGNETFPSATTAPEPATLTLMGLGMAGLMFRRPKK